VKQGTTTTETISLYTTVCPVTESTYTTSSSSPVLVTKWTASTIYSTTTYVKQGTTTTETFSLYTEICPVIEMESEVPKITPTPLSSPSPSYPFIYVPPLYLPATVTQTNGLPPPPAKLVEAVSFVARTLAPAGSEETVSGSPIFVSVAETTFAISKVVVPAGSPSASTAQASPTPVQASAANRDGEIDLLYLFSAVLAVCVWMMVL
jgi:chitinase